ncbi:MAG: hypothetical protein HY012_03955 [Acidobacteria bacterium]|nr:hypothetical protein [Acidobacteriota bacterium]
MRKVLGLGVVIFYLMIVQVASVAAQAPEQPRPQEGRPPAVSDRAAAAAEAAAIKEEWSVTEHSIRIGGQTIPYKASAGTTLLKNEKGEPTGMLYSVAYTRSDVKDLNTRPVSFVYNGGPGSASRGQGAGARFLGN